MKIHLHTSSYIIGSIILTAGSSHQNYLFLRISGSINILGDKNRDVTKADSNEHKSQVGNFFSAICMRVESSCFFLFYGRENVLTWMTIHGNAICLTCRSMKELSAFCDCKFHHWSLIEGQSERDSSISLPISFFFRCTCYSLLCKRAKVTFFNVCVRVLAFLVWNFRLRSIQLLNHSCKSHI